MTMRPYEFQEWVDRVVAEAPPMTDEQAARVSALFMTARPAADDDPIPAGAA